MLIGDAGGNPPDAADAKAYADDTEVTIPVMADATAQVVDFTPWSGNARPGKCVLSPEMVMLECYTGADNAQAFDAIKAHAGR